MRARHHLCYGLLGLPLAMAALPIYVQAPAYYADRLGLSLALTGMVLFGARLVDTVQDPWLGRVIDRLARRGRLAGWMLLAAICLALSFAGMWLPPAAFVAAAGPAGAAPWLLATWFGAMLVAVYTAHSALSIAYLAWGARLADDEATLTRAAVWREGAGLVGVVLASTLPVWLLARPAGMAPFAALYAVLLALGVLALLRLAPPWRNALSAVQPDWRAALRQPRFVRLLAPYFANAVAVAIPATLALFFINDRIGAAQHAGLFLGAYFLAGAAGLPLWTRIAARRGAARAWQLGMGLTVLAFIGAALLGPGDVAPYLAVCVLSGLALGADLALPPVLLAERIPADEQPAGYYGVFSLTGKLALALSGLALPLLAGLGYQPGRPAGIELAVAYALLPCGFKLLAWWLLGRLIKEETP
ncbi:MFS transporter [Chitiniphilus purpureus]|uniref:MFS transporter n=1 Tax=Chitiniphilus purpureus TaxID=2981137 RepID=A0ABY6DN90_9NEIS|nr:MFS transporter [Chitiniphilus sp. CD1]UXY15835.1 MFS transporter [Chitiniphilus sp. CD1]